MTVLMCYYHFASDDSTYLFILVVVWHFSLPLHNYPSASLVLLFKQFVPPGAITSQALSLFIYYQLLF